MILKVIYKVLLVSFFILLQSINFWKSKFNEPFKTASIIPASSETIEESIKDEVIYGFVKNAMIESGKGLIAKYNFDEEAHYKYIDKIIDRFKNPYLKDDVARVGREPLRKLNENDRLIKPLITARGFNINTDNLLLGVGAALHYANKEDSQSVQLQSLINEKVLRLL